MTLARIRALECVSSRLWRAVCRLQAQVAERLDRPRAKRWSGQPVVVPADPTYGQTLTVSRQWQPSVTAAGRFVHPATGTAARVWTPAVTAAARGPASAAGTLTAARAWAPSVTAARVYSHATPGTPPATRTWTPAVTVASYIGAATPRVGSYVYDYGATAPPGYLACDGATYTPAAQPALFAVLGNTFGGTVGTDFAVPDFRGRVPVGAGTGAGLTARAVGALGGAEVVTLTDAQSGLPSHTHGQRNPLLTTGGAEFYTLAGAFTGSGSFGTGVQTDAAGPSAAAASHENMQPWLCGGYWYIRSAL